MRGLEARRAAGVDTPLAIVSCDNLPRNGEVLRGLVADSCAPDDLADWIAAHADFPSTMVDRIVPATAAADRDTASRLIGARDEATVVGEPFSQWVIEDAFRGRRPAWEAGRRAARARHPPLRGDEAAAAQRRALGARLPRPAARARDGRRGGRATPSCARSWSGCGIRARADARPGPRHRPRPLPRRPADALEQPAHRPPARADRHRRREASCRRGCSRPRASCWPTGRSRPRSASSSRRGCAGSRRRRAERSRRRSRAAVAGAAARPRRPSARWASARCSARTCASRRRSADWWPRVSRR